MADSTEEPVPHSDHPSDLPSDPPGPELAGADEAAAGPDVLSGGPGAPPESLTQLLGRPVDERMSRYVDMLATAGVERGLIGPREVSRLWERHILNCVVLEQLIPTHTRVADIGSGAGLPGIVLALVRPDLRVTLVEPLLRRATFLAETIEALDLGAIVDVVRVRAEEYRGAPFSVVTARAVAPLDRLAALAFPLLTGGGTLLAVKGRQAHDEVERHRAALTKLGARRVEVVTVGAPTLTEPTTVIVVEGPPATRRHRR